MSKERELVNELFRKYLRPTDEPAPVDATADIERRLAVLAIRVAALERQLRAIRGAVGGARE